MEEKKSKAASECLKFIYHLRMCGYYATQFVSNYPTSIFSPIFRLVIPKIKWVYQQFTTHHLIVSKVPQTIVEIKNKWEGNFSEELALNEKITLLTTQQIETLNDLLDTLINGEEIKIEIK